MSIRTWWISLPLAYQNTLIAFGIDLFLFFGALLSVRPLHLTWDALTEAIPNILESIVLQLVSVVHDFAPSVPGPNPVLLVYGTLFVSLVLLHVVVGFGVGFLFDHLPRRRFNSIANYFALIAVLFLLHFILLVTSAPVW